MTIQHLATYKDETTVTLTTERFGLPIATLMQTTSEGWSVTLAQRSGFLGGNRPDERTYPSVDAACAAIVGWSSDCYRISA